MQQREIKSKAESTQNASICDRGVNNGAETRSRGPPEPIHTTHFHQKRHILPSKTGKLA